MEDNNAQDTSIQGWVVPPLTTSVGAFLDRAIAGELLTLYDARFSQDVDIVGNASINNCLHVKKLKITSDIRFKKNIYNLQEESINICLKLKPVTFEFKGDDEKHCGFIAQEVQNVFPIAVAETQNGLAIDPIAITSVLTKAFQINKDKMDVRFIFLFCNILCIWFTMYLIY